MKFIFCMIIVFVGGIFWLFAHGLCVSSKKREKIHDEWVIKNMSVPSSEEKMM